MVAERLTLLVLGSTTCDRNLESYHSRCALSKLFREESDHQNPSLLKETNQGMNYASYVYTSELLSSGTDLLLAVCLSDAGELYPTIRRLHIFPA